MDTIVPLPFRSSKTEYDEVLFHFKAIVSIGGHTYRSIILVTVHGQGDEPRGRQARMACPDGRAQGKHLN
jgi:hypothetical protein